MELKDIHFLGSDEKLQKAIDDAKVLAYVKAPVLIVGETGVGKATLGNYIHDQSSRKTQPFYTIDCSLSPQEVENSVLGHRDAQTGRFHKGALELANKGTVLFENIDQLEDDFQKRLVKIFSELIDYDLDVRFIATSNKNLAKQVANSRFNRSLYGIFNNNIISMSPLRERPSDLSDIINKLASELHISLDEDGMRRLLSHHWNRNITEIKEVLNASVNGTVQIKQEDQIKQQQDKVTIHLPSHDEEDGLRLMSLRDAEELLIKKALIHTCENRTQAAKILGVSIRTLRNKINEYRIDGSSYFLSLR